jgi:anti-sigma B factor antagonist
VCDSSGFGGGSGFGGEGRQALVLTVLGARGTTAMTSQEKTSNGQPSSTTFGISHSELDKRTSVISVEGELDLSTAPRLKWMLVDALEGGHSLLVVDLTSATFMDSTALGVLIAVKRRLEGDARMAIVCVRENVLKIFEFAGMDGVFAIFPTIDEALAYARGREARAS